MAARNDKSDMTVTEMARSGGFARARKLSKKQLSDAGRKAVMARWAKKNKAKQKEKTID